MSYEIKLSRICHELSAPRVDMTLLPGVLGPRTPRCGVKYASGSKSWRFPGGIPISTISRRQFMKNPGQVIMIHEQGEALKVGMRCPNCGNRVITYRNPFPAVDIIIELENKGVVLIQRAKRPYGWALPGGFVEYGEALEEAARREAREETSLDVAIVRQLGAYSAPDRDPRHHTISVVFLARAEGEPRAADDAREIGVFTEESLPSEMAFDHAQILADYLARKHRGDFRGC